MQVQDVVVGMEVEIDGFYKTSFPIFKIENDIAFVKGRFSDKLSIEQVIEIPIIDLISGDFENKRIKLKDCVKWDEDILVSNNGNTWYIRSFHSFGKNIGSVNTRLCAADTDVDYDEYGVTIGDIVSWKMFKRFNLIK